MNYGKIKNCDIANGIGVRVALFVSGCRNHCPNCFQEETWDFDYGSEFNEETEKQIITMLGPPYIEGLTILGGEPMESENQRGLLNFLRRVKLELPQKTIWLYSGFTLEELADKNCRGRCEVTDEILALVDVLVDGRYIEEKKDISLRFRGSSNQRIIDMKRTRKNKEICLWNDGGG